jgi:Fic family protein
MPKRDYETTHPWIKFERVSSHTERFWMLMGEARSKCDHIRYVPLSKAVAEQLYTIYLTKGINATTSIEGNTLSEADVLQAVEKGRLKGPDSQQYLRDEVLNMVAAYNTVAKDLREGVPPVLTIDSLCLMNKQILDGLPDEETPGELRKHTVYAGPKYKAVPWDDVAYLLERLSDWLEEKFPIRQNDERIPCAFVKAVTAHVYLEWIHPFNNGNGRLGRLVEFMILFGSGVPAPAAHILTSHYNDTRAEYYRQLEIASKTESLRGFLDYAAQGFVDGLTGAVKELHRQQERLMWVSFVDEQIQETTPARRRRRHVAIELGKTGKPVKRSEIRGLTPAIAVEYGARKDREVQRDLLNLARQGLVRIVPGGTVEANLALVRGMRPFVLNEPPAEL